MTKGFIAQARANANKSAGTMPSQKTLDKIAEQSITGGYKIAKSNRCGSCFQTRSVNGACACC